MSIKFYLIIYRYVTKEYEYGKYIGDYENGKREGNGIFYYNDGDKYEGEYVNNKREGKGIFS